VYVCVCVLLILCTKLLSIMLSLEGCIHWFILTSKLYWICFDSVLCDSYCNTPWSNFILANILPIW